MVDTEGWVQSAKEIHGGRYDYSKSNYTKMKDKLTITCGIHGDFQQDAWNHIQGVGCPSCGKTGFSSIDKGFVYLLQSDDFFKIGITNNPVEKRVRDLNQEAPTPFSLVKAYNLSGDLCVKYETQLHKLFRGFGYKQPTEKFDGYTECFYYSNICSVVDTVEDFMMKKGVLHG